jgi:suppressor of fused-like protein
MGQFVTNSIAIYPRDEPMPHWHLIGYAMTAPYEERGYEFTLRAPRSASDTEAPGWALVQPERLATYVSRSGNDFTEGHYIEYPHPLDPERPGSTIRAGALVLDQPEAVGGDELRLIIGSKHISQFTRVLPGRIPHGNALILTGGPALPVVLLPGPDFGHAHTDRALEVTLPGPACEEPAHAITAEPGDYRVPALPGLTVTVVP